MHRPSGVKEWQIPPMLALPIPPFFAAREEPDEEQETSYFALSVRIFKRSQSSIASSFGAASAAEYFQYREKVFQTIGSDSARQAVKAERRKASKSK